MILQTAPRTALSPPLRLKLTIEEKNGELHTIYGMHMTENNRRSLRVPSFLHGRGRGAEPSTI